LMIRRSRLVLEDEEGCTYGTVGIRYTTHHPSSVS
jgi:hypothetical protein